MQQHLLVAPSKWHVQHGKDGNNGDSSDEDEPFEWTPERNAAIRQSFSAIRCLLGAPSIQAPYIVRLLHLGVPSATQVTNARYKGVPWPADQHACMVERLRIVLLALHSSQGPLVAEGLTFQHASIIEQVTERALPLFAASLPVPPHTAASLSEYQRCARQIGELALVMASIHIIMTHQFGYMLGMPSNAVTIASIQRMIALGYGCYLSHGEMSHPVSVMVAEVPLLPAAGMLAAALTRQSEYLTQANITQDALYQRLLARAADTSPVLLCSSYFGFTLALVAKTLAAVEQASTDALPYLMKRKELLRGCIAYVGAFLRPLIQRFGCTVDAMSVWTAMCSTSRTVQVEGLQKHRVDVAPSAEVLHTLRTVCLSMTRALRESRQVVPDAPGARPPWSAVVAQMSKSPATPTTRAASCPLASPDNDNRTGNAAQSSPTETVVPGAGKPASGRDAMFVQSIPGNPGYKTSRLSGTLTVLERVRDACEASCWSNPAQGDTVVEGMPGPPLRRSLDYFGFPRDNPRVRAALAARRFEVDVRWGSYHIPAVRQAAVQLASEGWARTAELFLHLCMESVG